MNKIRTFSNTNNLIIISIPFIALFISLFIVFGELNLNKHFYHILCITLSGILILSLSKFNDKILIFFLVLFLTFNADYPLIYHPQIPGGTRPTPVIWLVDLPLLILFIKLVVKKNIRLKMINIDKLLIILFVSYLFWELITIINAIDYKSIIFQIIKDLRYISLFLIIFFFINNDINKLEYVIKTIFLAIIFQDIWAVIQWIHQSTFDLSYLGETPLTEVNLDILENYTGESIKIFGLKFGKFISGFAGSPYLLARENLLTFPLVFSMFLSGQYIINRYIHLAGIFLITLGLIFGFSKGAWIATCISFATILMLELWHKRLTKWKFCLGIVFSLFVTIIFGKLIYLRLFLTNFSSSFNNRSLLNAFGIERFIDYPIIGIGANNIWLYFDSLWSLNTTIHNLYILILCEIGIIGLLLMFSLFILIFFKTLFIHQNYKFFYAISVGLCASFLGFYSDCMWTWLYRFNPVGCLFWTLVAVSFSANNISKTNYSKYTLKFMPGRLAFRENIDYQVSGKLF